MRHNSLGVELQDCPWEPIRAISVDREGEHILNLHPKLDAVSHQLICDVQLENNIKVITLRSTLNISNETSLPIEMIVVDAHGKASNGALRIDPGEACPMPLQAAYEKRFRLRPLREWNLGALWMDRKLMLVEIRWIWI